MPQDSRSSFLVNIVIVQEKDNISSKDIPVDSWASIS